MGWVVSRTEANFALGFPLSHCFKKETVEHDLFKSDLSSFRYFIQSHHYLLIMSCLLFTTVEEGYALQVHFLFAAVCCFVIIIIIIEKIIITVINNNATDKAIKDNDNEIHSYKT